MSFLDGLFGAALPVAQTKLTTSATVAAGSIYVVETDAFDTSPTITIQPGQAGQASATRAIGFKSQSPEPEVGPGVITVRPPGNDLIESDAGVLASEASFPNAAGQYREWTRARSGIWYLVGGAAGGGGGGEAVDPVARAAAAAAQATANAVDTRTSNVTNDAQLKRSGNDWSGFAEKATPVDADMLLLEDSAAGGAKKRVSVVNLGAAGGGGSSWSVADNINPLHYYRASVNVQSGGLVDQLTDTGRVPKHFTQAGGLRAPIGTDPNGKQYLALDASGKRYTAGVASDWKFLGDGNAWTACIVMQRTPKQTVGAWECLLATMNWVTGSPGMFLAMSLSNAGAPGGPATFQVIECGVTPFPLMYLSILRPNVTSEIWVLSVVYCGQVMQGGGNGLGWTGFTLPSRARSAAIHMNGVMLADCNSVMNLSHPGTDPAGPLTLGAFADGSTPSAARIFEVLIEDRALPTDDVHAYAQDAATRYAFTLR